MVRAGAGGAAATFDLGNNVKVAANSPGTWGSTLAVTVDQDNLTDDQKKALFNLSVGTIDPTSNKFVVRERWVGLNPADLGRGLSRSRLVVDASDHNDDKNEVGLPTLSKPIQPAAAAGGGANAPGNGGAAAAAPTPAEKALAAKVAARSPRTLEPVKPTGATDPTVAAADVTGDVALGNDGGIYALNKVDIFNILCLPTPTTGTYQPAELDPATEYCTKKRAMLIVDPPNAWTGVDPLDYNTINTQPGADPKPNVAIYYPNLQVTSDPGFLVGPSGAIAGVWAATDQARGVWKAPAGTQAAVAGIVDFAVHIDEDESGILNPLAVNALRRLPLYGPVVWGARTSVGADATPDEWKYVPVRRTALFIEESLRRGTQWAVFEPNAEPLWSSLRLNVGVFMNSLWRKGAFAGSTKQDAYFVQCDADVNPQDQVDLGIVNILVGFAPLKPAEFVVISIEQLAGQLQD